MTQLTGRRSSRFLAEQAEAAALEAAFDRAVSEWEADPEATASLSVAPVDWECDPPEWEPTQSESPTAPQSDPASGLADVLLAHGFPAHVTAQLLALADSLTATNPTSAPIAAPRSGDDAAGADDVLEDGGSYRGSVLSDAELTAAAEATVILGRWAEEHLLTVLSQMSLSAGRALLDTKEVTSPDELSKTGRLHWRRDTKSALAAELELLTGKGRQICHDLIGIALAPPASTAHARAALAHGDTDLAAVRTWFDRCRSLTPDEAAGIAAAVFQTSAPEQHGPAPDQPEDTTGHEGPPLTARQSDKQFRRDLSREVTRAQGTTPHADAERRKTARAQRHASVRADDDGTACLTVRGPTSAIIAAWDRIDVIARKARAAGDPRTIAQLRADATTALLIHGIIPGAGQPPQTGQTGQTPQTGQAPHGPQAPQADDCATTDPGAPLVDLSTLAQISAGTGPVQLNVILPLEALLDPDSHAVGELADHGTFLTAGHLRELALQPGSTLFRIVTDPATGVCLERSTKGYRPDKAMLELLRAMDVLCRAPGCTTPAARCQLDHERPYDHDDPTAGGRTSATNLATKDQTHHNDKTKGLVTTLLNPRTREITWRTLFGRIYATWPHDYTQYTSAHCPGPAPTPDPAARLADPAGPDPATPDPATPDPAVPDLSAVDLSNIDLRDRLIYAALTERTFAQDHTLAGWDDHEDADPTDLGYPFTPEVDLLHHTAGGAPRRGPDPTHPTTYDLLHPGRPDPSRPGQQDPPDPDQDGPRPPF